MCTGTLVRHEQTVRDMVQDQTTRVRPVRRRQRVCMGTPVHHEHTVRRTEPHHSEARVGPHAEVGGARDRKHKGGGDQRQHGAEAPGALLVRLLELGR
jgi:hypothetical protein